MTKEGKTDWTGRRRTPAEPDISRGDDVLVWERRRPPRPLCPKVFPALVPSGGRRRRPSSRSAASLLWDCIVVVSVTIKP